jgi:hypothetical protein
MAGAVTADMEPGLLTCSALPSTGCAITPDGQTAYVVTGPGATPIRTAASTALKAVTASALAGDSDIIAIVTP